MPDEIALQKDVNRAQKAGSLLDNELLKEAFEALEKSYVDFWRATKPEDQLAREKAFIAINIVGKVRDHLHAVVQNGKLATAELNKMHADAERKKRFGII
jgi:hypothetical protein